MRYLLLLCLCIFSIYSCSKNETEETEIEYLYSGDVTLDAVTGVSSDVTLSIAPGSTIRFKPGAKLNAYGNISIVGTEEAPITLISEDEVNDHWILEAYTPEKTFDLKHVYVVNGLITTHESDCHFQHVNFFNNKQLVWNSAATRFWGGKILIEDCRMEWNRSGEGFLVHNIHQPIVRDCWFTKVNDAVEYLDCTDGVIRNCMFVSNSDDAIDLNNCDNIIMTNNEFYGTQNRGMEIGSEGFGNSTNIKVINNLFVDCKIAVNVKENSDAIVENITIVGTETGMEIRNDEGAGQDSYALLRNSVIVDTRWPTYTLDSSLDLENCLSEDVLHPGTNVIQAEVIFADTANNDYTIISDNFPEGMDASTIGYHRPR